MVQSQRAKHSEWIDVLNILSCIAVVALHVSLNVFTPERSRSWLVAVAIQATCIFAVPVFFMISGMNLINYRERYTTRVFFQKRFKRTGLALIGASLVCYLLFSLFPNSFYNCTSYIGSFGIIDFIKRFLTNTINDIYWFLYSILYLYLLTPLLSLASKNKRLMQYLIILCILAGVVVPFLEAITGLDDSLFATLFGWPLFKTNSLLYFLLGAYIGNFKSVSTRGTSFPWVLIFIACSIAMALAGITSNGYFNGTLLQTYNNFWIGVSSPLCVLEAVSLFMLIRENSTRLSAVLPASPVCFLSKCSLGIYLFHNLFLLWLPGAHVSRFVDALGRHPFIKIAVVYLVTLFVVALGRAAIRLIKQGFASVAEKKK